jgi:hypothetical protein
MIFPVFALQHCNFWTKYFIPFLPSKVAANSSLRMSQIDWIESQKIKEVRTNAGQKKFI